MAKKRWITGEEILERWQAAPFELVDAMVSGKLVAVDPKTGVRFCPELFQTWEVGAGKRCFFCTKPVNVWLQECFSTRPIEIVGNKEPIKFSNELVPTYCEEMRPELTIEMMVEEKITKAVGASFILTEVEEYERIAGIVVYGNEGIGELSNGSGLVNENELIPEERQELGRLRLEKDKWGTSIKASITIGRALTPGKRFTRKEVWKILTDSGIHGSDLPDAVFNQIWAGIPSEFRNIGGRPKTVEETDF